MNEVRAILVSDIHLQESPPVSRSHETDWFAAMRRPLDEIERLRREHDVPVVYGGDIFNRWKAEPSVINFALAHLPPGYAVPGQHDLPNHSYTEIRRSAYWTLVEAALLQNLEPGEATCVKGRGPLFLYGFPWGFPVSSSTVLRQTEIGALKLAVVHGFIWKTGTGYEGASDEMRIGSYSKRLAGYDAALFGDNHIGFDAVTGSGCNVCNAGGLYRRKSTEAEYRPGVGLLLADGTVRRHYLDTSQDVFTVYTQAEEDVAEGLLDVAAFSKTLESLAAKDSLDFAEAVRRYAKSVGAAPGVVAIVEKALEE